MKARRWVEGSDSMFSRTSISSASEATSKLAPARYSVFTMVGSELAFTA